MTPNLCRHGRSETNQLSRTKIKMIKRITKRFTPKQYLAELLLGLTALLGLYLIVAWSSYTPLDNSWSTASFQTETINKAGALVLG